MKFKVGDIVRFYRGSDDWVVAPSNNVFPKEHLIDIQLNGGVVISIRPEYLELVRAKPEKKKLWQWAIQDDDGLWESSIYFYGDDHKWSDLKVIKLEHTMIEVDDENL